MILVHILHALTGTTENMTFFAIWQLYGTVIAPVALTLTAIAAFLTIKTHLKPSYGVNDATNSSSKPDSHGCPDSPEDQLKKAIRVQRGEVPKEALQPEELKQRLASATRARRATTGTDALRAYNKWREQLKKSENE